MCNDKCSYRTRHSEEGGHEAFKKNELKRNIFTGWGGERVQGRLLGQLGCEAALGDWYFGGEIRIVSVPSFCLQGTRHRKLNKVLSSRKLVEVFSLYLCCAPQGTAVYPGNKDVVKHLLQIRRLH